MTDHSNQQMQIQTLIKHCLDADPPIAQIAVVEDSLNMDTLTIKVHGPAAEFGEALSFSDDLEEVVIDDTVYRAEIIEDPYGPETLDRITLYGPSQKTESVDTDEAISQLADRLAQEDETPAQLE